jgi:hypothetical protein
MEHTTTQGRQKTLTSAEVNKQTTVLAQHQVVAIAKNLSEQKSHIQDDNTHQTTSCGSQQTIHMTFPDQWTDLLQNWLPSAVGHMTFCDQLIDQWLYHCPLSVYDHPQVLTGE